MTKNLTYDEARIFCLGVQNNKEIPGWKTLNKYNDLSNNPAFTFKVYEKNNQVVLALSGTNIFSGNDWYNGLKTITNNVPSQYEEAQKVYDEVERDYGKENIKLTGYSLGATLANMISCKTGTPSTAIAPPGGYFITQKDKNTFSYGDSNIVTYGRKNDIFFGHQLNDQLGKIYLLPNIKGTGIDQHYLHNFQAGDAKYAQEYKKPDIIPTFKQEIMTNAQNSMQGTADAFERNMQNLTNSLKNNFSTQGQNLQQMINNAQDYVQNMQPILNNFSSHENKPYINMDVPTTLNNWYTKSKEDVLNLIASMPIDEFNARQVEIMNYFNPTQKSQQKAQIFENYATVANALKRIITKEDVNNMSIDEFNNNWDEIKTQMSKIGVPSEKELPQNIMTYTKQKQYEDYSNKDGRWVTIKGNHVFIES